MANDDSLYALQHINLCRVEIVSFSEWLANRKRCAQRKGANGYEPCHEVLRDQTVLSKDFVGLCGLRKMLRLNQKR